THPERLCTNNNVSSHILFDAGSLTSFVSENIVTTNHWTTFLLATSTGKGALLRQTSTTSTAVRCILEKHNQTHDSSTPNNSKSYNTKKVTSNFDHSSRTEFQPAIAISLPQITNTGNSTIPSNINVTDSIATQMTPYHIIKYAMTIDAQQHDIETILSNIKFLNYNGHCPAFQYIGHIETFLSNLDQIDLIAFNKTIKKVIFSTLDGPYFSKTGESYETDESYTEFLGIEYTITHGFDTKIINNGNEIINNYDILGLEIECAKGKCMKIGMQKSLEEKSPTLPVT
ncbi:hypothetical protein C6P44_002027, partial [Monosporozyma unispora]